MAKHAEYSSLKKLCTVILDFEMDKYFCEADWKLRPLSEGMLDYARGDSHYLIAIYCVLMKLLNPFALRESDIGNDDFHHLHQLRLQNSLYLDPKLLAEDCRYNKNDWLRNIEDMYDHLLQ